MFEIYQRQNSPILVFDKHFLPIKSPANRENYDSRAWWIPPLDIRNLTDGIQIDYTVNVRNLNVQILDIRAVRSIVWFEILALS